MYGVLSLDNDYKSLAWSAVQMTQFLIKDNGGGVRNLLETNPSQFHQMSLSLLFGSLQWGANGSETSSSAYSGSRVYSLAVSNFGINDAVLNSSLKTIILLKFGERDGVQDSNKDRSMIAWQRYNYSDNVDSPSGIGCFTLYNGAAKYRDIVPNANAADYPSNITGAPYAYTLWVR